jgi:hypothetical protein
MKTALAAFSLVVATSVQAAPLYVGVIGDGMKAFVYGDDIVRTHGTLTNGLGVDKIIDMRFFTERVTANMRRNDGQILWNTTDVRYRVDCESLRIEMLYSDSYLGRTKVYSQSYRAGQYAVVPPSGTEMYNMARAVCNYQNRKDQKEPK